MPKSVYEGFQEYLSRLEPKASEVDKRKAHKKTVEQAIAAEFPGYTELTIIGSHTRETAIHLWSDVDYFAKLGVSDVTWGGSRVASTTTLDRTKKALQARFRNTNVRIDGPAVVVEFEQGAGGVDVVPGVWVGTTETQPHYPVFEIPDGVGGWRKTSPQRHTKYLRDEDERSGYKLSKTIRLLKGWKYSRSPRVPLLGFHLELLLASESVCVGARTYQQCLIEAFRLLRDRNGAALNDPLGISGRIPATATEAQRDTLVGHAKYAVEKAAAAIDAEECRKIDDAFYYWDLVFNRQFPAR